MAEPTSTLQQLRRDIAQELQMPFARRFKTGYSEIDASSTTTKIIDASLTQKQAFWNGSWYYHVSTQEVSKIRAFDVASKAFQLEIPLAATPSAGDDYEVHTIWNAIDIHKAINRAIKAVQRIYVNTVTDETFILQEDTLDYSLSALTATPWVISKVWIEYKPARRGQIQSAGATSAVVESTSVTSGVNTNWRISIYDGTGKGQLRSVVSVAGTTINVAAWTTVPDTTSKYCLWDSTEQLVPWRLIEGWRPDAKEWPTVLYINNRMPSLYGMRIRIEYMAYPSELSIEADTTIVPAEYIINKACSLLFGQRLKDNKVDRETYYAESERYRELADTHLARNQPHKPDVQLKSPYQTEYFQEDDPLGWNRRF